MLVRTALTLVIAGLTIFAVSAQAPRPTDNSNTGADAVNALVTELRAVRADLADASQRTLRFQLLLARLQLQEQRIGHLDRQRADVAKSLMDTQTLTAMFNKQFEQMSEGCEDAVPEERKACDSQLETIKVTATTHQAREQQLRLQEQELTQAIATEQNRWADFSSRLDDLERALARPR